MPLSSNKLVFFCQGAQIFIIYHKYDRKAEMLFDSYDHEMDVMHEGDDGCCSSGLHHKTLQEK